MHDRSVARAAKVRGDLLGPLVGRAHRVRPADRIVIVRFGAAELVQSLGQKLRGLQVRKAGQRRHLVEAALQRTFGRSAVVADDQVDQRVVEDAQILERVDQAADVMVGVLQKARIDFHLARENRLHFGGDRVPGGNFGVALRQLGNPAGMTPSSFCRANVSSRSLSQPWSNLPSYLSAHSFGT